MKIARCVGLVLLVVASTSHAQDRTADPLQKLARCFSGSEFRAASTDRLPASITSRSVETAKGPMPVSLADGYRMMIHRQGTAPLVNLKIERSVAGKFDADRAAILLQMDMMAAGSKGAHTTRTVQDGIEVIGLNQPAIGTTDVNSVYELFDKASGTIATAYILEQPPAVREYVSQAGYDGLRDRFVGVLSKCMAHRTR